MGHVVNSILIFNSARERNQQWEIIQFREALIKELLGARDEEPPELHVAPALPASHKLQAQAQKNL